MGRNKISTIDLAAEDLTKTNTTGLGHVSHMKYAVRAIKEITTEGNRILAAKDPAATLKRAIDIKKRYMKDFPHCIIEILNLKGEIIN